MENSPKFFLYARKSTDESSRQVLSIEGQLSELHQMARREGLAIVREFVESRTAKKPGHPIFNEMMDEIDAGKAQGIIAWHPDRLARNSVDGGRIVHLVDTGGIRALKFPTFHFEATAHGKFMLSIAFSQSKYYVDNLSENIKRSVRLKLGKGIWPQWAPMGYVNDRTNCTIVVDEQKAPLIRKAFDLYGTGDYSLAEVRSRVNSLGLVGRKGRALSVSNYHILLQNPIYYGAMRYAGELYEGKHHPIVTKRLFDRVQEVMRRKSKPKTPQLKSYRYRGLFRCGECGCGITTETQKGYNYLRCTKRKIPCQQRYVREEVISAQIAKAIGSVSLPAEWAELMLADFALEQAAFTASVRLTSERWQTELSACDAKLDTLFDLVLAKIISNDEYAQKKEAILSEKAGLREKLATTSHKSSGRFELLTSFINEAKQAAFLAQEQNPDAHRDFVKKHGSNFHMIDGELRIEFKNPWKSVLKSRSAEVASQASWRELGQEGTWR